MTLDPNLKLSDTSKYTISPIGPIPADWNVGILGDYSYIKARIGWRGLSSSEYTDEGPYLIAGKHIAGSKIKWDHCDHLSEYRYEESKEIQLQKSDIIISKDGTIGRLGFIDFLPGPATINGTMMLIRPDPNHLYPKFIYHYFQGSYFQRIIQEKVSGSSVPHIFQRDMVKLLIPLFSIQEQKKIAAILSSVDDAIQATQAVIYQTHRVKQGLMQHLLTRGIGHTRFKQTEIGEIPDSWKFIIIDNIASFVGSGVTPRGGKKNYLDKGIPLVRSQNVHFGNLRLDNVAYISEETNAKMQRTKLHDGDVLLNITGASIGRCTFVPKNFGQGNVNQHVCIIRCISKIASYHYVAIFLESLRGQSQIQELQAGLSREGLNFKQVRRIKIPLPPISEQNDISNLVMNVNESIIREERTLESLFNLKRGLMQDLLSGRVRVNGVK